MPAIIALGKILLPYAIRTYPSMEYLSQGSAVRTHITQRSRTIWSFRLPSQLVCVKTLLWTIFRRRFHGFHGLHPRMHFVWPTGACIWIGRHMVGHKRGAYRNGWLPPFTPCNRGDQARFALCLRLCSWPELTGKWIIINMLFISANTFFYFFFFLCKWNLMNSLGKSFKCMLTMNGMRYL